MQWESTFAGKDSGKLALRSGVEIVTKKETDILKSEEDKVFTVLKKSQV